VEDLNDFLTGDTLTAAQFIQPMSEVQNIIEDLGIVLTNADLNQLGKAIAGYVANGAFYAESGIADAYILAQIGLKQAFTVYADGTKVSFIPGNDNTGASTINVSGVGVVDIRSPDGTALTGGELLSGVTVSLRFDTAAGNFRMLEVYQATGTALLRTVSNKLRERVSVLDFIPTSEHPAILDGTTTFDSAAGFQAAALASLNVEVPRGTYLNKSKTSIRAGQIWMMHNPTIKQDGVAFTTILEADDIAGWAILGRTICKGTLVTGSDVGAEIGLVVKGCSRYRVEGYTAENMRSHGIHVQVGASAPAPRGDQGQFTDCAAHQGRVGVEIDPGASSEFNVFSNFNAAGNLDGAIIGAGNSLFMGGNIVDNTRGITLVAGSNHAHGSFIGTQINHNNEWNMKAISVLNGHTFSGCHFFGNGGATSPIFFENSKGISIDGGIIDCAIRCDGTTGQNAITNNYIPTTTPALFGTNPEFLRILSNWTDGGAWNINDGASEYSLVARGTSTQAIPSGTVLVFNSAEKDKRSLYNLTTGLFTTPTAGVYAIKILITVSGSGFLAAGTSFVELQKNGVNQGFVGMTPVSDTVLVGSAAIDLILAVSDVVRLVSKIVGTSPVLAITSSRMVIELDQ